MLDLHRRAGRTLEAARAALIRAVDQPGLLETVRWPDLAEARVQVEMLGPAVSAANRHLQVAQETIHAATENRLQAWSRYSDLRRRWESPATSLTAEEERAILRELVHLAGPA